MQIDRRRWLTALSMALGGGLLSGAAPLHAAAPPRGAGSSRARLSLNENPFGPAPGVRAALEREMSELCRYTTEAGYDALVTAIARKERIDAAQVILGEILEPLGTHLAQRGGAGGEFIYSDPGYTALIDAAVAVGARAVPVPLSAALGNDLGALEARIGPQTRALYLVNPHNPTGTVSDPEELRRFARDAARRTLVIVDEAYLEFADRFESRTLADLVRAGDNVIVFRTFAKIYGLAGLEIGYGLVPKPLAAVLKGQGLTNPHLFNRLAVAAAAASLEDPAYIDRVRQAVAAERHDWEKLFRSLGRRSTPSAANFVFFETGLAHEEFASRLAREGIEIGREFKPYDRWARISIGLPEENSLARAAVRDVLSGA
ncbi:MAG TPA: histidinol-phosphate transaminase [Steroidobacteraceae bacterium]|nr:histidinol-phosphate transaminase [Steroidobacteraceae bacterium]